MLFSAVSVLVVAQSSSEIPEGFMNNPVYSECVSVFLPQISIIQIACAVLYCGLSSLSVQYFSTSTS